MSARSSEQGSVLDAHFHEMMRNRLQGNGSAASSSANSAKQAALQELIERKEELERLKAEAMMAKRYAQEMAEAEMRAAHEELRALEEQKQKQQQSPAAAQQQSQQAQPVLSLRRVLLEQKSKLQSVPHPLSQVPSPPKPQPSSAPRSLNAFEQLMHSVVAHGQQQQQQMQQASSVPIPVAQPVHAQVVPVPPAPPMAATSTVIRSKPNSISWVSGQDDQASSSSASSTPPRAASNRFAERAREFRLQKAEALAARLREEADRKNDADAKRNSLNLGYVVPPLKLDRYNSEQFVNQTECEEFECSICFHIAFDPVDLETCSHHFCRSCLESWGKKFCPTCTNSFEKSKMKSMTESKTKLWTLQIKCEHASRGCEWVGALGVNNSLYLDHLKSCAHVPVNCLHCQQSMNRSFVETHRKEFCPFRLVKCQFCKNELAANKMSKHVTLPQDPVKNAMYECKEESNENSNSPGPCVMTRYCPYKCQTEGAVTVRHVFNIAEHMELQCPNRPIDCILCPPFRAHSALSYEAMKDHMTQVLFQSNLNQLDNGARGQSREEEETVQQLLKAADELTRYRKNFGNNISAMVQPVEQHIIPIAPPLSSSVVPQAPPMHAVVATPPTRSIGTVLSNSRQDKMREEKEQEECVDFPMHPPLLLSSNSQLPRVGLSADQKKVPSPKAAVLPAASLPLPPVLGRSLSNPSSLSLRDSNDDGSSSSNRRHRTPPAHLESILKKKLNRNRGHAIEPEWESDSSMYSEHASDLSDFSGDEDYEEIEAGTKKADIPVALAGSGAMAASALAAAAASSAASSASASPPKDKFIDLFFNLQGISENTSFKVLRGAPLSSVLSQNPFNSIRQKVKFYIVSEDGRDWDEVHESCTPVELGLPDRSKIGMKL